MEVNIFPIPLPVAGSLAIVPRPRGGDWLEDDIRRFLQHDIQMVVSLLCDSECIELGLEQEAAACSRHQIEFVSLPVPDLSAPADTSEFIEAVHRLATLVRGGTSVAVHCRQSVGRSGLLTVSIAVGCGMALPTALEMVSKARGVSVPETDSQKDWLHRNAGRLASSTR